jgi:hypothetical protein
MTGTIVFRRGTGLFTFGGDIETWQLLLPGVENFDSFSSLTPVNV